MKLMSIEFFLLLFFFFFFLKLKGFLWFEKSVEYIEFE
jgi:hypothetical protein